MVENEAPVTRSVRNADTTKQKGSRVRRGQHKRKRDDALQVAFEDEQTGLADSLGADDVSERDTRAIMPPTPTPATVQASPSPGVMLNFIGNRFVASKARTWILVHNPATQQLITRVPDSTMVEVHEAVTSAESAQKLWSRYPLSKRRKHLLLLMELIRTNELHLANAIIQDVGKTLDDAISEISRSINMIEAALSVTSSILGYHFDNEATETHTINEPLGVTCAITPFNFPLMIPMWFIPFSIATGNSIILKPSEQAPSVTYLLGQLFLQSGFPPGVFSIVYGGPAVVDKLLAEPAIQGVSFVGSDEAGAHVHNTSMTSRKRVQANCGGKNHGVLLPDARRRQSLFALAASAFGAAGQRCMGLSVAVFVGESIDWLPELVQISAQFEAGIGSQQSIALGPVISRASKKRIEDIIAGAEADGASILLDGRGVQVPNFPDGNFVGPTIISGVQTYMECYQKEILGPVLVCLHVKTLDEAIELINDNRYGNGCTIFTSSAKNSQKFQRDVNVGRIGINVPLLATSGQVSNSSNKDSFLGDINVHGFRGHQFFTTTKTISSIWRD